MALEYNHCNLTHVMNCAYGGYLLLSFSIQLSIFLRSLLLRFDSCSTVCSPACLHRWAFGGAGNGGSASFSCRQWKYGPARNIELVLSISLLYIMYNLCLLLIEDSDV